MSFFLFFGGRPRFRFGLGGVTARVCTAEVVAGLLSDSSSSSLSSSSSSSKSVSGFDLLTMISSSDSESSSCVLKDPPANLVFAAARFAARLVDGEDDGRKVVLSEIVEVVCTGAVGETPFVVVAWLAWQQSQLDFLLFWRLLTVLQKVMVLLILDD